MDRLEYLTVPDIVWINLLVTEQEQRFNYARLEEAAFNQYAYGSAGDVAVQGVRFLNEFIALAPFEAGNEATAFVAFVAFLKMNGHDLGLIEDGASSWSAERGVAELEALIASDPEHHEFSGISRTAAIVEGVVAAYPRTIASLVGSGRKAALFS